MGPTCRTLSIAHWLLRICLLNIIAHWLFRICLLNISHSDGISWLSVRIEDSPIPVEPVDSSFGRAAIALNHFWDGVRSSTAHTHWALWPQTGHIQAEPLLP